MSIFLESKQHKQMQTKQYIYVQNRIYAGLLQLLQLTKSETKIKTIFRTFILLEIK